MSIKGKMKEEKCMLCHELKFDYYPKGKGEELPYCEEHLAYIIEAERAYQERLAKYGPPGFHNEQLFIVCSWFP